jgi:outer membrane lipoprotein-sorting protein
VCRTSRRHLVIVLCVLFASREALAEPTAEVLLARYDQLMNPAVFEGLVVMVAHRQDDTTRRYEMRFLKSRDDKVRVFFHEPASARGQELLRVEDNLWVYLPNLKRALRIASRQSFQGGDFNNADLLRVDYTRDFTATFGPSDETTWRLDLKSRTEDAAYDRIALFMSKTEQMPTRAEYFAVSGKLLRSATFGDVKAFHGLRRPSHVVMRNELATKRYSELFFLDMRFDVDPPPQRFVLDDLGR